MEKLRPKVDIKLIAECPILQTLKDKFGVSEKDLIVAYGNIIYCPEKSLSRDLIVHELTHCDRQRYNEEDAKRWWEKYLQDEDFRLQEESLAYGQQYKYCLRVFKDRNKQTKILYALAADLSSERYGKLLTVSGAIDLIKNMV